MQPVRRLRSRIFATLTQKIWRTIIRRRAKESTLLVTQPAARSLYQGSVAPAVATSRKLIVPQESPVSLSANQDAKDRIRQAIDIVDLVGGYIPLRRQGRNFVGICPWHDDARPSLQVNPDRGSWKCWVCNIGGDIFNFVMQREGVEFREALQMLADRAGISLANKGPRTRPGDPNDKRTLYEATAWAEKQFRDCLRMSTDAEVARTYFADRKLTAGSLDAFHLGFAPNSWQWLLDRSRSTSFTSAVLHAVGLAGKSEESGRFYDFFRGRVIFPIRDGQGRPIAFGARVLPQFADDRSGKYINTRETRLFSKSEHVYALDLARDAIQDPRSPVRNVIVVEGYMDVIMCHQHGIKNVVAVLGTALGPRHIQLLRRYADRITLVLDGDEAGQRRTNEVLELFIAGEVDLRIATLPDDLDPCEFLEERSADDFRQLIDGASDAFEHAMRVQTSGLDAVRDTHRANQALESLLGIVAKSPRLTSDTSTSRRLRERQVLSRLAREFHLEESILRQRLAELRKTAVPAGLPASTIVVPSMNPGVKDLSSFEIELIEILVRHPELAGRALSGILVEQVSSAAGRCILETYHRILEKGESCEFQRILGELEEPHLKHLLVELDERAGDKEMHAHTDAATRLQRLIDDMQYRFQSADRRRQLAELDQRRLASAEELQLLQQIVEQERKRQGIPAPTDG